MTKQTILLCDDNLTNLHIGRISLRSEYNVLTAENVPEMFKQLETNAVDLILLDIDMPETDGFEAMRILKASGATSQIPVIFLTGTEDDETKSRGRELGAVDFITKPFIRTFLLERVRACLLRDGGG